MPPQDASDFTVCRLYSSTRSERGRHLLPSSLRKSTLSTVCRYVDNTTNPSAPFHPSTYSLTMNIKTIRQIISISGRSCLSLIKPIHHKRNPIPHGSIVLLRRSPETFEWYVTVQGRCTIVTKNKFEVTRPSSMSGTNNNPRSKQLTAIKIPSPRV